ncbi:MAG: hypothetical protein P1P90_02785 [Patescibacteria group bacterium]|nr:hypothetical protein [Patescibacteria group bacterium]
MRVALSMDRMIEQYFQSCIEIEFEYRKPGDVAEFGCQDACLFELLSGYVKKILARSESAQYPQIHRRPIRWNTIIKSRICAFRLEIYPPEKIKVTLIERS